MVLGGQSTQVTHTLNLVVLMLHADGRDKCPGTKTLKFQSGVPFWRRTLALDVATLHCNAARGRQLHDRDAQQSDGDVLGAREATDMAETLGIDRNVEKLVQTVQTVYKPFHKPL